jgi:hypothetical protein
MARGVVAAHCTAGQAEFQIQDPNTTTMLYLTIEMQTQTNVMFEQQASLLGSKSRMLHSDAIECNTVEKSDVIEAL